MEVLNTPQEIREWVMSLSNRWIVSGPDDRPFDKATTGELVIDWDQVTVVE